MPATVMVGQDRFLIPPPAGNEGAARLVDRDLDVAVQRANGEHEVIAQEYRQGSRIKADAKFAATTPTAKNLHRARRDSH
jgi:hypothetical protein